MRIFAFVSGAMLSSTLVACSSNDNGSNSGANGETANGGSTFVGGGGMPSGTGATTSGNGGTFVGGGGSSGVSNGGTPGESGGSSGGGGTPGSTGGSPGSTGGQPSTVDGGSADGGGGVVPLPPFPTSGMPLTGPDNTWTWIDFPDSHCRDGSTAGVSVNMNSASKNVMIFLQGGGACFDATTCGLNPANASTQKTGGGNVGVFDRTNADNPVKDWNYVFVPYCTGDSHIGTNANGTISGVAGTQQFVGRLDMEAYLNRIVPTFKDATEVVLTGVSAGGFGAASNEYLVQRAFGTIPVAMIDDSGPPMSDKYIPTCLQKLWRTTWGLDGSVLKDCGSACSNPDDYELDFTKFVTESTTKAGINTHVGLLDSNDDGVITLFYGYGQNNCTGSLATPVPAATYDQGLDDFRTYIEGITPNFSTFYPPGTTHTWLASATFYTETVSNVRIVDWFKNIVVGGPAQQIGN